MYERPERPAAAPRRVTVVTPGLALLALLAVVVGLGVFPVSPEDDPAARVVLGTLPGVVRLLAFSPDGRRLAAGSANGAVTLWDLAARGRLFALPPRPSPTATLAFAPDLAAVAFSDGAGSVAVVDLAAGPGPTALPVKSGAFHSMTYAPDGTLAVGRRDGSVVLHAPGGRPETVLTGGPTPLNFLAFARDSRTLAAVGVSGDLVVWERGAPRAVARLGQRLGADGLEFTGDGRSLLVSSCYFNVPRVVDVATGQVTDLASGLGRPCTVATFTRDGRAVALALDDGKILLRDVASGRTLAEFLGHQGPVWALTFSPDGHRLASGGNDMTVRVWPVAGSVR